MLWATVPETSVNKDCQFVFWKTEVGGSNDRIMPTPTSNLLRSESSQQNHFRGFVAFRPDLRHDL